MIVTAHIELAYYRLVIDSMDLTLENQADHAKEYRERIERVYEEWLQLLSDQYVQWRFYIKTESYISKPGHRYKLSSSPKKGRTKIYIRETIHRLKPAKFNIKFESVSLDRADQAQSHHWGYMWRESYCEMLRGISSANILNRYLPGKEFDPPQCIPEMEHALSGAHFKFKDVTASVLITPPKETKRGRITEVYTCKTVDDQYCVRTTHVGKDGEQWTRGWVSDQEAIEESQQKVNPNHPINQVRVILKNECVSKVEFFGNDHDEIIPSGHPDERIIYFGDSYELVDVRMQASSVTDSRGSWKSNFSLILFEFEYVVYDD